MFEFFFKRFRSDAKSSSDIPGSSKSAASGKLHSEGAQASRGKPVPDQTPALGGPVSGVAAGVRTAETDQLRQRMIEQAFALDDDESAAVGFILSCGVAEARIAAAQKIHSRAALLQVRKAMRETDRRVSKLMQQRLDLLALQERSDQQAQTVLERARGLCDAIALLPNQVIDLEQSWHSIDAPPQSAQQAFNALHVLLTTRLQAQLALQRQVLNAITLSRHTLAAPPGVMQAVDLAVSATGTTLQNARVDAELASLPKHLLPELAHLHTELQQRQQDARADLVAVTAHEEALSSWEKALALPPLNAAPVALGPVSAIAPRLEPAREQAAGSEAATATPMVRSESRESILQAWRSLPAVGDVDAMRQLQMRFDALLASSALTAPLARQTSPSRPQTPNVVRSPGQDARTSQEAADRSQQSLPFAAALETLQTALDDGLLQKAVEHDRLLRSFDIDALKLTAAQQAALAAARGELGRLQSWAKWGGTVSREELLAAAEALPQQALPVAELAKKVGSMRERWRALDASAGPAPRALWSRFDAACNRAYAPVTAHFEALALERAANAQKARVLLDEVATFVRATVLSTAVVGAEDRDRGAAPDVPPDWHAMASFRLRIRQAWQRLGPLERREQKRADAALAQAIAPLDAALGAQQEIEIGQREKLIDEVMRLAPQAADTPERLQALQTLWQHHAKTFPLTRQVEQLLWHQFRAARDAVFAERKSAGAAADAERSTNLQIKIGLCELLEKAASDPALGERQSAQLMREVRGRWDAAGQVPRAMQAKLHARFSASIQAVEAQRLAVRQAAARRDYTVLRDKLTLCQKCEIRLVSGNPSLSAASDAASNDIVRVSDATDVLRTQWSAIPVLGAEIDAALTMRFETALSALLHNDAAHADALNANQPERDAALLRLEVAAGIHSPPAFIRDRLAIQVASLQSTLKNGAVTGSGVSQAQLAGLLAIPALADPAAQSRVDRLLQALSAREGSR